MVHLRLAIDKVPEQPGKPFTFHHLEICACRKDRALDLHAIADDARILHQLLHPARCVARNFFRVEAIESAPEVFPLAQNGDPGKAGLKAIQNELLIERAIFVFRHAPFLVVIMHVKWIELGPRAARDPIRVEKHAAHRAASTLPGKAKRAHAGLCGRSSMPPAVSRSPAARASATRSRRSKATPRPCAVEPSVPTDFWPALTGVPASGAKSSKLTATARVRAVPRCSIRDTTSWPTKQPLAKSMPPS